MKVLVTGGCGFLGSHVCEFYKSRADDVIAFDNMTPYELMRTGYSLTDARDYNAKFLSSIGVQIIRGDVCDYDYLLAQAQGCSFLIHTAAQPAMTISIEDPELDFSTNLQGTFNVLKVARELSIPVVSCSTIHVYGNKINESLSEGSTRYMRTPAEIDEHYPTLEGKLTPLHASKRAAEIYVQTFIDCYGIQAASFRFTGLYGPRQFGGEDHGWIANFSIRTLLGWPITIFGTAKQVRDILFVKDAVEAIHAFYEKRKSGVYNIGGGYRHSLSLEECINIITETIQRQSSIQILPARFGDLWYFVCDASKAERDLGWKAKVAPTEGIAELVNWINDNIECFTTK